MRLQLHKDFTFADAAGLAPYLRDLGVSHLYASPILTARAGSIHSYDVIDPTRVNPELGGETGLRELVAALRAQKLGLIVDIVPNHMAVGGGDNAWWQDVLQNGPDSRYARYFDIDWAPPDRELQGKVLAPFLGRPYGEALEAGEIRLERDAAGDPVIRYFDDAYLIRPRDYSEIATVGVAGYDPATPDGRARLHRLLERQHYRLAWWGTAGDEINWRRFFDINGLAGLRVELPEVFEATHATLFRLYAEGLIDGFRIDHVDGLSDPPGYCRRLRARLDALASQRPAGAPPGPATIVVEKILGSGESLPTDWGVDGTSGYDFMDAVSLLQHDPAAEPVLAELWSEVSGRAQEFGPEEVLARREILRRGFNAQLEAAATTLHLLARLDPVTRDVTQASIRRALLDLLSFFPVYRTYNAGTPRLPGSAAAFARALERAKASSANSLHPVLDHLDGWLGGAPPDSLAFDVRRRACRQFQQLSAPVAAKAVEDTAFYRYGRLLSRNDVGFDAATLGLPPAAFHANCQARLQDFPDAMLATATHDHKRGEDVRARLAVLSEFAADWAAAVRRWMPANARYRTGEGPSPGDEAMLYQMIVGAWPPTLQAADAEGVRAFAERLGAWQVKAAREAKLNTDWTVPHAGYEDSARDFLFAVLAPRSTFLAEAARFARRIGAAGAVNGLAQTLLKLTAPGVADFYQGTEFWDFSLVDPDNRRPVDFPARIAALQAKHAPAALADCWQDGRVKLALIARVLAFRQAQPALFARGGYRPLALCGPLRDHAVAFLRTHGDDASLTLVPRLAAGLLGDSILIPADAWAGTCLDLPDDLAGRLRFDALAGGPVAVPATPCPLGALLRDLPVALLSTAVPA